MPGSYTTTLTEVLLKPLKNLHDERSNFNLLSNIIWLHNNIISTAYCGQNGNHQKARLPTSTL